MSDAETMQELRRLALSDKNAIGVPDWGLNRNRPANPMLEIVCPLALDGVVEKGLALRIYGPQTVLQDRPFYGLCAHLVSEYDRRRWHLGRIEFDPENRLKPHRNPDNRKDLPPQVSGRQQHLFSDNECGGPHAFTPTGNLPVATSLVENPTNFNDILTIIGERFVIPSLWLEEPPWLQSLL